jgi:hypothetical protein
VQQPDISGARFDSLAAFFRSREEFSHSQDPEQTFTLVDRTIHQT